MDKSIFPLLWWFHPSGLPKVPNFLQRKRTILSRVSYCSSPPKVAVPKTPAGLCLIRSGNRFFRRCLSNLLVGQLHSIPGEQPYCGEIGSWFRAFSLVPNLQNRSGRESDTTHQWIQEFQSGWEVAPPFVQLGLPRGGVAMHHVRECLQIPEHWHDADLVWIW